MPELPEVETVARTLAPLVEGQALLRLRLLDPRLAALPHRRLSGRRVARVFRLGKQVLFELAGSARRNRSLWLGVHLRMTGRLLWRAPDAEPVDPPQLRAVLVLERGAVLFQDTRRFGTLTLHETLEAAQPAGLDPTSPGFTVDALTSQLRRAPGGQLLKPWLLRQDRLVGIGNIYASEILWHARLSPRRRLQTLKKAEIANLWRATSEVLEAAIAACGTTFADFQDARGDSGSYQHDLRVYGRAGEPCAACGGPVSRFVQQQRATFFCPCCQR